MQITLDIPDYIEDGTISDEIERRVADRLLSEIKADTKQQLKAAIVTAIQARADEVVEQAMQDRFQRTNHYGEPIGEPVNIRELIMNEAAKRMDQKVNANTGGKAGYRDKSCTFVEWRVKQAIGEAVKVEVEKIEAAVHKQAVEAMAAHLAQESGATE